VVRKAPSKPQRHASAVSHENGTARWIGNHDVERRVPDSLAQSLSRRVRRWPSNLDCFWNGAAARLPSTVRSEAPKARA